MIRSAVTVPITTATHALLSSVLGRRKRTARLRFVFGKLWSAEQVRNLWAHVQTAQPTQRSRFTRYATLTAPPVTFTAVSSITKKTMVKQSVNFT